MESIDQQRCFHHVHREAVVKCPLCRRYFCRECVTEHDDRMLCADCLQKASVSTKRGRGRFPCIVGMLCQGIIGFLIIWCAFYYSGRVLLAIPDAFHEGTLWEKAWKEAP